MTVELPKDAEGREIPLDVEFLYNANGESVKPYSFTFRRYDGFCWEMRLVGLPPNLVYDTNSFYLTPPDSWEKLEEDARKTACNYAPAPRNEDGLITCDGCPFEKSESCGNEMTIDLVERAKKLAGIEEEARND